MKKFLIFIFIAIMLPFALATCSSNVDIRKEVSNEGNNSGNERNTGDNVTTRLNDNKSRGFDYSNIKLSGEEAFDIFKEAYPEAKVKEIDFERKGKIYVYEVEGYMDGIKYEIKIDPMDGKVLKTDTEKAKMFEGEISKNDVVKIPELIKKAINDVGKDFQLKEWSLELSKGRVIFEIEMVDEDNGRIEYKYDCKTGNLIKMEVTGGRG